MLPSPAELRERSRFYIEASDDATDPKTKQRLAACAFVLAQVAESIERDEQAANANAPQLARAIADALDTARGAPPEVARADEAKERAISQERSRIRAWRMRAAELRATADNFEVPSAQEPLRRAAANYEQMADHAEALLTGKPKAPGEETG
jgi:hypothetical protein